MKILITGNLGYVGPWVTRQLRSRYPDASLIGVDIAPLQSGLTILGAISNGGIVKTGAGVLQLDVPLKVDIKSGSSWADCEPWQ